jgi:hypothetical protein
VLQLGAEAARPILELAYARVGPSPAAQVLHALEWAATPAAEGSAPSSLPVEALRDLPAFLQTTASAVDAVRADREGRGDTALVHYQGALDPATAPAMAAWIGYQALDGGHLEVARAAALKAIQLSAQHKHAQGLAARIALADGRLSEAQEAMRGVDPSSRDAVVLEAVSAYENLQGQATARLLETLPGSPSNHESLQALRAGDSINRGRTRLEGDLLARLADDAQVWGGPIAVDLALDVGDIAFADALVRSRAWDGERPVHAARMLRLRRYQGQSGPALQLANVLLDAKQATLRGLTEAMLSLVDAGRAEAAASALSSQATALGALAPWLGALVESARGRYPSASKSLAELDLPGKTEPVLLQVVALRALVASKERRAKAYFTQLAQRLPKHPDVAIAARALGLGK